MDSLKDLKDTLTTMTVMFNNRMNEFQQDLDNNNASVTNSSLVADFNNFKRFILSALTTLQRQIEFLSGVNDRREIKTRCKMLLFHGVPKDKGKDSSAPITSIVAKNLTQANFSTTRTKSTYRLGRPTSKKLRPIVVRFSDTAVWDKVWYAKTKLKGTGVTQSKFLTKTRHYGFLIARKRYEINRCWMREGTIFAVTSYGTCHQADCLVDIDEKPGYSSIESVKLLLVSNGAVQKAPKFRTACQCNIYLYPFAI
ncbi:unnamed protein product [Euphydryas editha]|uniref:Uncharacterized protein n=1 Tax=Euphydryas editha TaxID=104508 RepID=A0AAU9VA21_EUPED|nr:unnamed protein product [Euphydryas editha]